MTIEDLALSTSRSRDRIQNHVSCKDCKICAFEALLACMHVSVTFIAIAIMVAYVS
jgi:hypothetical protein